MLYIHFFGTTPLPQPVHSLLKSTPSLFYNVEDMYVQVDIHMEVFSPTPYIDCSQLYLPATKPEMEAIENVQKVFTKKIQEMKKLNY